jgi:hypothetical protein
MSAGEETVPEPPPAVAVPHARVPAVDLTAVVVAAEIATGTIVVARILARRPSVPRTRVTMGPGGWVSVKGGSVGIRPGSRPWRRPRQVERTVPGQHAPIWARVLSAVPLQVLSR